MYLVRIHSYTVDVQVLVRWTYSLCIARKCPYSVQINNNILIWLVQSVSLYTQIHIHIILYYIIYIKCIHTRIIVTMTSINMCIVIIQYGSFDDISTIYIVWFHFQFSAIYIDRFYHSIIGFPTSIRILHIRIFILVNRFESYFIFR